MAKDVNPHNRVMLIGSEHILIERIYDAALDATLWPEVVSELKTAFGAIAAGLFVQTRDNHLGENIIDGIGEAAVVQYGEHYAQVNPWFARPGLMVPGRIVTDKTLEAIESDSRAFLKTEMCQDWCIPQDFRHAMGGSLADREGNLLNFTFFRPSVAGFFTDLEVALYASLRSHLLKAVEINARLERAQTKLEAHESVLNRLRLGVIIVDWNRRVIFTNTYAGHLLATASGIGLMGSRIAVERSADSARLEHALSQAIKYCKTSNFTVQRKGKAELSVSVLPVTERRTIFSAHQAHVAIVIADPDDRDFSSSEYLETRWGLTPTEARFAYQMLQGKPTQDIAESMKFTRATAQWYMKQILNKVAVNRQSELIFRLMNDLTSFLSSRD